MVWMTAILWGIRGMSVWHDYWPPIQLSQYNISRVSQWCTPPANSFYSLFVATFHRRSMLCCTPLDCDTIICWYRLALTSSIHSRHRCNCCELICDRCQSVALMVPLDMVNSMLAWMPASAHKFTFFCCARDSLDSLRFAKLFGTHCSIGVVAQHFWLFFFFFFFVRFRGFKLFLSLSDEIYFVDAIVTRIVRLFLFTFPHFHQ